MRVAWASVREYRPSGKVRLMSRLRGFPWWQLATSMLLSVALVISGAAGRFIEAIIIGLLLLASLALGLLSFIAWRRDRLPDDA
jgi:hypothetical protein